MDSMNDHIHMDDNVSRNSTLNQPIFITEEKNSLLSKRKFSGENKNSMDNNKKLRTSDPSVEYKYSAIDSPSLDDPDDPDVEFSDAATPESSYHSYSNNSSRNSYSNNSSPL